jgi:hypothetical protein
MKNYDGKRKIEDGGKQLAGENICPQDGRIKCAWSKPRMREKHNM